MQQQITFPIEFSKCPVCGCPDTVCRLAVKEEIENGRFSEGQFVSLEKVATPLIDPKHPPAISAQLLLCHYDCCAKCGTRYCTRAEKVTGVVGMKPGQGQGPKGFGFHQG